MLAKDQVAAHYNFDCLICGFVVEAVIGVGLLEFVPIEQIVEQYLGKACAMRLIIFDGLLKEIEKEFVNGVDLLDIAKQLFVGLNIFNEVSRRFQHILYDELQMLAISLFGLKQLFYCEYFFLVPLEQLTKFASRFVPPPTSLDSNGSEGVFIPFFLHK